jgi:hypothetical protein
MDIQTRKIELVKTILQSENTEFIQKVTDFVNKESIDFWDKLNSTQKNEIKNGIDELNLGKRIYYESFLRKISR